MTLRGNDLFRAQDDEGDAIRRERRWKCDEFVPPIDTAIELVIEAARHDQNKSDSEKLAEIRKAVAYMERKYRQR